MPSLIVSTTLMSLIVHRVHLERVPVEDHQVGELAGLERAFRFLLDVLVGDVDGHRLQRLHRRDALVRADHCRRRADTRLTAVHTTNIWSSGATTKSVWLVGRSPLSIAVAHRAQEIRLLLAAVGDVRLAEVVGVLA